ADVRRVALRDADEDAGEQAGTARVLSARGRTVSSRRAPAMTTHAGAPGLVGCIADRAIAAVPADVLHRAGLAGAAAAATVVANRMVRVAACPLALARRGVAGRADRAVACPGAERCRWRAEQFRSTRRDRTASELIVQLERRQTRRWALDIVAAEGIGGSSTPAPGRRRLHVRL